MRGEQAIGGALAAFVLERSSATAALALTHTSALARSFGIDPEHHSDVVDALAPFDRDRMLVSRMTLATADVHVAAVTLAGAPVRIEERVAERGTDGAPLVIVGAIGQPHETTLDSRFLSDVLNTLPDAVFVKDREHRWIALNEGFCQFLGRTRAQLIGKTDHDFFPPEQVKVFWEHDDKVLASDAVDENEELLTDAAGMVHVISTRKAAFTNRDGQRVIVGALRDITEKQRLERELVGAMRAKTDFVANISHELRTPLNGILGMTQLLGRRALDPVELEYLDVITASGEALLALVDDVLDFGKIEAGRLDLDVVPFSPTAVVEDACAVFAAAAAARGVELIVRLAPDLPARVLGDGARLRQIVINLVSNAVKFTSAGEVVVDAVVRYSREQGARLTVAVTDSGVGLSDDVKERLFLPFTQADASITRRFGGTGLGLAISQRLARLMGGEISADGAPGRGSTFTASLPTVVADTAPMPQPTRWVKRAALLVHSATLRAHMTAELARFGVTVVDDHADVDIVFVDDQRGPDRVPTGRAVVVDLGAGAAARGSRQLLKPVRRHRLEALLRAVDGAAGSAQPGVALRGRALVVDDSAVNQRVLVLMLEHAGVAASVVRDGLQAIELLGRERFDVVLMDCQMPELDGVEAARRIRASTGAARDTPIVAVTADNSDEGTAACLAVGMNAVVTKPVRVEELMQVLRRFVPAPTPPPLAPARGGA